jgi:Bacterial capsule synthesis protein PGA_cap
VATGGLAALTLFPPAAGAQRYAYGVRLCAGGDVTLGSNLDPRWARTAAEKLRAEYGLSAHPASLLAPLRPLVADADVVLLNVEGAIGQGPVAERKCGPRSTNCYAFRQPVSAAAALRDLAPEAIVVGNVANNHSRDAGGPGFAQTARHLRSAGVRVTGADTLATRVVTLIGDTLAVLGFHTTAEGVIPDARNLDAVYRHVARAVGRYGTVVVTMHLGAEGAGAQRTRNESEIFLGRFDRGNPVAFADTVFAAGATLIIGHGPHVLRAGEWRDNRLVLYSLGNLLTYGPFNNREPTNRGAIACVTIDSARHVSEAELRSTVQIEPGVLRADPTERAVAIIDSLSALDFPATGVRVFRGGAIGRRGGEASGPLRGGERRR